MFYLKITLKWHVLVSLLYQFLKAEATWWTFFRNCKWLKVHLCSCSAKGQNIAAEANKCHSGTESTDQIQRTSSLIQEMFKLSCSFITQQPFQPNICAGCATSSLQYLKQNYSENCAFVHLRLQVLHSLYLQETLRRELYFLVAQFQPRFVSSCTQFWSGSRFLSLFFIFLLRYSSLLCL